MVMLKIFRVNRDVPVIVAFFGIAALALLLIVFGKFAFAQFETPDFPEVIGGNSGGCGNSIYSASAQDVPKNSELYVRTNTHGASFKAALYSETESGCKKSSAKKVNSETWTKMGSLSDGGSVGFSLNGSEVGGDPFQAVATVMVVPKGLCTPKKECKIKYLGKTAELDPNIVTAKSDFLAIAIASAPKGTDYEKVEYYGNDKFLYVSDEISEVNRNYLQGGEQVVKTVVYLVDGQKVTFVQKIQMGSDPLGTQFVRSWFYRQSGSVKLVIAGIIALTVAALAGLVVRKVHRIRRSRDDHGLNKV